MRHRTTTLVAMGWTFLMLPSAWSQPACPQNCPPAAGPPPFNPLRQPACVLPTVDWKRKWLMDRAYHAHSPVIVKLLGPNNTTFSIYAGGSEQPHESPVQVGMYSNYIYAFKLSRPAGADFAGDWHGTVEVVRGPWLPKEAKPEEFPIPVRYDDSDLQRLSAGGMLTKFIVLEDPDRSYAVATDKDNLIRFDASYEKDAIRAAKEYGKILLVVRIGNRVPTLEELRGAQQVARLSAPPTAAPITPVALWQGRRDCPTPGGAVSGAACAPAASGDCPPTSASCPPPAPRIPDDSLPTWEYIPDGGDTKMKAKETRSGVLLNVDPSDTVAKYWAEGGCEGFVPSNRVLLYAPRFIEVSVVQGIDGFVGREGSYLIEHEKTLREVRQTNHQLGGAKYDAPLAARMRQRPTHMVGAQWDAKVSNLEVLEAVEIRLGWAQTNGSSFAQQVTNAEQAWQVQTLQWARELISVQFPQVLAMQQGVGAVTSIWHAEEKIGLKLNPPKCEPICIKKFVTPQHANVGDEVTFTITYENVGETDMTGIALHDSLVGRLEYVPKTAKSSRDAIFFEDGNDAGSSLLRWEIKGVLPPKESGKVQFKAKVR